MTSNLLRIYKDKKAMSILWMIILIPIVDLILLNQQWESGLNPILSLFLVGMSEGHIMQILLFWFLPIYLLIFCSDTYIQDVKTGTNNIIISKIGKRNYLLNKILTSFFIPSITMFSALMLNFGLAFLIYHGNTASSGLLEMEMPNNLLFSFSQEHPLFINFIFSMNVSLFSGLAGLLGLSISLIFPDQKYTYPLTFVIWFILVSLPNHTITMVMQPLTEYDYNFIIPAWILNFLVLTSITIVVYVYKVKTDEL